MKKVSIKKNTSPLPSHILTVFFDSITNNGRVDDNIFNFQGVLVSQASIIKDIYIRNSNNTYLSFLDIKTDLSSPKMQENFPKIENSGQSRFKVSNVSLSSLTESSSIGVVFSNGEKVDIGSINVKSISKVHPLPYQKFSASILLESTNVEGKSLLEIGGDLNFTLARYFIQQGVSHVTSTNIDEDFPQGKVNEDIDAMQLNVYDLSKTFASNTFDLVVGIAILEHVSNLELMLDQIYQVLKPGGFALLNGSPIWTSARGHHIWVKGKYKLYKFNDKTNPIPNWYHILLDEDSMLSYLHHGSKVAYEDAKQIVEHIYSSPKLSRLSYAEFFNLFNNSKFKIVKVIQGYGNKPTKDILDKLLKNDFPMFEKQNFEVGGLDFLVRKL
jgi:SAM-dependent methyltransferase